MGAQEQKDPKRSQMFRKRHFITNYWRNTITIDIYVKKTCSDRPLPPPHTALFMKTRNPKQFSGVM